MRRGFKGPFAHEYIDESQYDARLTHALQLFQFSFKTIMLDICQGLVRLASIVQQRKVRRSPKWIVGSTRVSELLCRSTLLAQPQLVMVRLPISPSKILPPSPIVRMHTVRVSYDDPAVGATDVLWA